MRFLHVVVTLFISLLIAGCGFVHDERITGPYRLIAVDTDSQMSICYGLEDGSAIGRIGETVFEYGFDKRFIVAKQHPGNNQSVTNYFFLDMSKDSKYAEPSDSVTGPLGKKEFEKATRRLNLPKFSHVLKYLNENG